MLSKTEYEKTRKLALKYFSKANIILTEEEKEKIEVSDFGLNKLEDTGLILLEYVNTERCCSKELVLTPHQTCPQHLHPPMGSNPGKEETFRCRWGEIYLYIEGEPSKDPIAKTPKGKEHVYTVWHEIVLKPGMQYTLQPGIWHWFQAGPEGAVVSEFSTHSNDELDNFWDKEIQRIAVIED